MCLFNRVCTFGCFYVLFLIFGLSNTQTQNYCHPMEFRCHGTGKCIPRDQVRNERLNCGENDTSDEDYALDRCQSQTEFRCRGNGQCVPRDWINRKISLCSDRSDEGGISDFPCNNRTEFRCEGRGRCIKRAKVDDKTIDCLSYGSDEGIVGGLICDATKEYKCPSSLRCIPRHKVLDEINDCIAGEDEKLSAKLSNCHPSRGEFQCDNGRCIERLMVGDGYADCPNHEDEKAGAIDQCFKETEYQCESRGNNTGSLLHCIPRSSVNDGIFQCEDESDENVTSLECFQEDWSCDAGKKCIERRQLCDGILDCQDGSDETDPKLCSKKERSRFFRCAEARILGEVERPFAFVSSHYTLRSYFCDDVIDCADASDEREVGEGFKCRITRNKKGNQIHKTCVLPPDMINDGINDCDDGSDEQNFHRATVDRTYCLTQRFSAAENGATFIKRSQVCDGVFDCSDLSDECLCSVHHYAGEIGPDKICRRMCRDENRPAHETDNSTGTCHDCPIGFIACADFLNYTTKCIRTQDVCNGVLDCLGGLDESFCTESSLSTKDILHSENNYKCILSERLDSLSKIFYEIRTTASRCDGIPECPGLDDECNKTTTNEEKTLCENGRKRPKYCDHLAGQLRCNESDELTEPLHPAYVCDGKIDCPNGIDERYCDDLRFACDVIQPQGFFNQFSNTKKRNATNGRKVSIATNQVCDGLVDCVDQSDERNCSNHFYCHDRGIPFFVSKIHVLDGHNDCTDGSDECPDSATFLDDPLSSRDQLIKHPWLRAWIWLMTFVAIVGNICVMLTSAKKIFAAETKCRPTPCCAVIAEGKHDDCFTSKRSASALAKCNDILILNLATADFLTGIYLFGIAIKASISSGVYCSQQIAWRSSAECESLGILIVTACQASVGTMVALTTYRLYAVIHPWKVARAQIKTVLMWVVLVWTLAVALAVIPTITPLRNYFVMSAVIAHGSEEQASMYFLSESINKNSLVAFLNKACALSDSVAPTNLKKMCASLRDPQISWKNLQLLESTLFPGMLSSAYIGYYGEHGVCLPALFPRSSDRQMLQRTQSYNYTAAIMTLNFVIFIYVSVAYSVIWCKSTTAQTKSSGPSDDRSTAKKTSVTTDKRIENMHKRIARIVATNFFCWVPVCLVSFCGISGAVLIPTWVYSVAAVVLLPINSAVNPILYSDGVHKIVRSAAHRMYLAVVGKLRSRKGSCTSERSNNDRHFAVAAEQKLQSLNRNAVPHGAERNTFPSVRTRIRKWLRNFAHDPRRPLASESSEAEITQLQASRQTPELLRAKMSTVV